MRQILFTTGLLLCLTQAVQAQAQAKKGKLVDRRDQAEGWYLPVHGQVMVDGKNVGDYTVELWKGEERLGDVATEKDGDFKLDLDIDNQFLIRVKKEGFEDKLVLIDTSLPADLVTYPDYECYVNLIPRGKTKGVDEFYTDFPSAIVRYNEEMGGFYHSEHYLDHIQTKVAGFAQASF